ncbi:trypsin-like peptidase domain-containing protein [Streptomyces sp. CRPSP2-6A1]|nr:trypsin-like peptidase domain-containing protein [Streptomyces sp. CRPSP2-6A1]
MTRTGERAVKSRLRTPTWIARIEAPDGAVLGAGVLLAPDRVLTAGHVVTPGTRYAVRLVGVPGQGAVTATVRPDEHVPEREDAFGDRSGDLALLRLAEPLPAEHHPPLPAGLAARTGEHVRLPGRRRRRPLARRHPGRRPRPGQPGPAASAHPRRAGRPRLQRRRSRRPRHRPGDRDRAQRGRGTGLRLQPDEPHRDDPQPSAAGRRLDRRRLGGRPPAARPGGERRRAPRCALRHRTRRMVPGRGLAGARHRRTGPRRPRLHPGAGRHPRGPRTAHPAQHQRLQP